MTYLFIGLVIVLVAAIALLVRASRHTYRPTSVGATGRARQGKLDGRERSARWGAGS
jgi:hypothetical protein